MAQQQDGEARPLDAFRRRSGTFGLLRMPMRPAVRGYRPVELSRSGDGGSMISLHIPAAPEMNAAQPIRVISGARQMERYAES